MPLETYILDIIEGNKSAPFLKAILFLFSQVYRAGVVLRHFAYDRILSSKKLSIPVISVGNIVAGGTGKTPVVHYLATVLSPLKIAILSRGYRRKGKKTIVIREDTMPQECGDEPYMLSQKLPQVRVIVGRKRILSGQLAELLNAKVVLLDDGMQYRSLHRDIEIGVMHADDLFGKGFYLPRGLLRDHPKRLSKADLLILTGVKDEPHFEKLQALLKNYSDAPVTAMQLSVENSLLIASKKVASFCAIASPKRFYGTLKQLGCEIVLNEEKSDHLPFSEAEVQQLSNRAQLKGATCLVCTEKDAVKLPRDLKLSLPLIPVKITLQPTFGKEHLEKIVKEVKHDQRL